MTKLHSSMSLWLLVSLTVTVTVPVTGEVLKNGGFESLSSWDCWSPVHCDLTSTARSGQHAVKVTGKQEAWQGPSQYFSAQNGHQYHLSGYVKLLNDNGHGQSVKMTVDFHYIDDTDDFVNVATKSNVRVSDGWVHLTGDFTVPNKALKNTRVYFEGPEPSVQFLVDDASMTQAGGQTSWRDVTDRVIDQHRKSDIHVHVTTAQDINKADVEIRVKQTKKSFPFGTAVAAPKYNANAGHGKYRDFIHKHFNWAVPENALKWYSIEHSQGHRNYQPALDMIHGLRSHGIKVRGHNLLWSVDRFVQDWIKHLSADTLRTTVQHHIQQTMNVTTGLLEHWDVNNENLHGHFYEHALQDPDYNLKVFDMAHKADPTMKLFLNEYDVVASGGHTSRYRTQAHQVKTANVGLYGIGVQCHFGNELDPDPNAIKLTAAGRRFLDLLENQWMTDETHVLSQSGDIFTVRGFHGDYELHVVYQGHDLANLTKTFTLGKANHRVNVHINV